MPKIFNEAHLNHNIIYTKSLSYHLRKEFRNNNNRFSETLKYDFGWTKNKQQEI